MIAAGGAAMVAAFLISSRHPLPDLPQPPPVAQPAASAERSETSAAIAAGATPTSKDAHADDGMTDICGVGKVRLAQDDPSGMEYVGALAKPAEAKWIATLQASSDLHARAAGLVLAQKSEALALLALQNSDPALYRLALDACGRTEHPDAACSQVSAESWAQVDADNASPWLQVAWRARLRGDSAGEAAAMKRAAAALRIDDYYSSLFAYAQPGLPADVDAAERFYLSSEAIGVEAAGVAAQYPEASKYCSRDGLNDPRVADDCRRLADLFDSRGHTLLDLVAAKSIGARVGWSQQRIEAAAKYLQALQAEAESTEPSIGGDAWSCGVVSAANAFLDDVARVGEVAALRERLEQSGVSIPELAQRHLDYTEKLIRTFKEQQAGPQEETALSGAVPADAAQAGEH